MPCTYVAEKPCSESIVSLTPPAVIKGLFSERYRCKILRLCVSHVPLGIRCEYLLSAIGMFDGEISDADEEVLMRVDVSA